MSSRFRYRITPLLLVGLTAVCGLGCSPDDTKLPTAADGPAKHSITCWLCARPLPDSLLGINVHYSNPDWAAAIADLGIGPRKLQVARIEFDWFEYRLFQSGPPYDPNYWHEEISELTTEGVDVLAVIGYRWADISMTGEHVPAGPWYNRCLGQDGRKCVPSVQPDSSAWKSFFADWKSYVDEIVSNYGSDVKYWAAWDEPTNGDWFLGDPWQLDSLETYLCTVVHARGDYCVGPEGGVRDGDVNGPTVQQDVTEIQARADAAGVDFLSFHAYRPYDQVDAIAAKFRAPRIWVTETGELSPSFGREAFDPEFQERGLVATVSAFRNGLMPHVNALFWFDLESTPNGLVNGVPANRRPAFYALQALLADRYPFPYWGDCTSVGGTSGPCPFAADTFSSDKFRYDGLLTVRVVDQAGRAIEGQPVLGYMWYVQYGTKLSDPWGNATFRVDAADESGPGVSFANASLLAPDQPSVFDGIAFSSPLQQHFRTFVIRAPSCTMSAQVLDQYGSPVSGVRLLPYRWNAQYPVVTTNSSGMTPAVSGLDCSYTYGFQIQTPLPAGYSIGAGQTWSLDGIFSARPPANLDDMPAPVTPHTAVFRITRS